MYRLSSIISLILLFSINTAAQSSPHGVDFAMDCAKCHSPESWTFNAKIASFSHDSTDFKLSGQHRDLECRSCHTSLEFKQASSSCVSCHTDIHQQTVGTDCARCHTADSWLVDNITELHEKTAFPLIGVHATVNCTSCHQSENNIRFSPTGVECISCHSQDYALAKQPDHVKFGFSTDCASCHSLTGTEWMTNIVDHSFFPLTEGHAIDDCAKCHANGDYSLATPDCYSCHQADFMATVNPNHGALGFSIDCKLCHSLSPGWMPVDYKEHDATFFPIYSGKHKGLWDNCASCHTDAADYSKFSCVVCHTDPETSSAHLLVSGYSFNDNACLACHPTGDADAAFDHNNTGFPLTGAHKIVDCIACHANGYNDTPAQCVDCHLTDFAATADPDHEKLGLSQDCASCHTTDAGWQPATFAVHDQYYTLNGAHAAIAGDCAACHTNGNYTNTPNTCNGCHNSNYTAAVYPNHVALGLSTDCASCHTTVPSWSPATFAVHNTYYPLTGAHAAIAGDCAACHANGNYANTPNTCNGCHNANYTSAVNPNHVALGFSTDCASCHTTAPGWSPATFAVHDTYYPLTGAHASIAGGCAECHAGGNYANTPNTCNGCHNANYTTATNPNHVALGLSTDCATCHTTSPGWSPATFAAHNTYYPLTGAHAAIAGDCAECHAGGNYANTPNTCNGCHNANYTATTNPNHVDLGLSTDCATCHTTAPGWSPATFAVHNTYYPLTGAHASIAGDCAACHTNGNYNNTPNTCNGCHNANYTTATNPSHVALGLSTDCASCHTTASGWSPATFAVHNTYYPLTGAHAAIAGDCAECHAGGNYSNTPNTCNGCHNANYTTATNPNHVTLGLSTDCASCHTTTPGWSPATFAVHNTYYPLTGAHASIAGDCAACHANGNYTNTPNTCNGCHNANYTTATNPNHVSLGFSTDCASCHTTAPGWSPATFVVHNTYYPLTGAHAAIAGDCAACHANGNYTNTPNTCNGCHNANYTTATNPNHVSLGFSTDCATCHTTAPGWSPATFAVHNTYYPLTGAHASIAGDCVACHANGNYANTPNTCNGCHSANYTTATNPNHVSLGFSTDCATCHTTAPGWSPATFAVHNTYYPLTGAHASIAGDCAACHANGNYANTPNTCNGCHNSNYTTATNPNHVALGLSTDCASCHTTAPGWSPATFAVHNTYYPLTGAHASIAGDCAACHTNGNYTNTPNTCNGCHNANYTTATNPNHVALGLSTDCASCHTTAPGWSPATFAVHNTYYPLTGAHASIAGDCAECHAGGNYANTPNTCNGCHNANYTTATNPNHVALGLSTDCASCHTTAPGWSPATFAVHNTYYPLTGAHASIAGDCAECHAGGNYANTPNTCNGCHNANYTAATNPNHVALGLSTDCASCHTTAPGWSPATFAVHNTYYPLTGAHASIAGDCAECHAGGNYANTPNTCNGCHNANYTAAANPNHIALGLSTDCASCHTTAPGWSPATFAVHNTYYPLTGAHASIAGDCAECHAGGNYTNTPNTCNGCHNANYTAATNPNHVALSLSTNCASCHTTAPGWSPATFAVHNTYYPLTGAHASIAGDCAACHAGGNYNNTPNTCNGCHNSEYISATNPNHVSLGLSTNCATCHTTAPGWSPATFAVHNTYYPLTGAHASIAGDCAECHAGGNYANTPNTCNGCHNGDYTSAANPNHVALNLSTDCASCHTTAPGWSPATFAIHNTYYPLIGAHAAIASNCIECHAGGNYSNTPNTCFGCHASEYNGTNNPDHQSAGFPTDCTVCHSQTAWEPSTWDHDILYFPIFSGQHEGEWDQCSDCHTNSSNYNIFTCLTCHSQNETNGDHQGVSGYQYNSNACYACHPNGEE